MSELVPLLQVVVDDVEAGRPVGVCCIVKTKGSTPQVPGATMLVRSDFTTVGTLGGGCVEAEVRKTAFTHLQNQQSALMDFVLDHDESHDDGLICGGRMIVAMETIDRDSVGPFREALGAAQQNKHSEIPLRITDIDTPQQYLISIETKPTLVIAGGGHVGQAVAKLAVDLDFHVLVIDDRAEFASRDRFDERVELIVDDIPRALRKLTLDENCLVIIVTRGHRHDHTALEAVVRAPTLYTGLIGSKRKSRMILDDLKAAGVPQDCLDRVRTPIGLPIGAVTVPEIAVSILAELIQERRKVTAQLVKGPFDL